MGKREMRGAEMKEFRRTLLLLSCGILAITTPSLAQASRSQDMDHPQSEFVAIKQEFAEDQRLHAVSIEMSDGYIYLTGYVGVLEDARQAVKRAQKSGHVAGVVSRIEVATARVPDTSLRLQVVAKLSNLEVDFVRVRVRRGVVKLSGIIASESERENILSSACSTPGVKGIDDSMQVQTGSDMPSRQTLR